MTLTGHEARELGEALIDAAEYIGDGAGRVAIEAVGETYAALPDMISTESVITVSDTEP